MAIEPVTREERFLAAAGGRSVTPPTPITRKEQLLQGIIDAVKSGGATPDVIEGAVNDYLNANPVQPGATTEQAAQIEQNKNDIADLQAEIEDKQPKGDYVKTVNGKKPDATGNVVVATGGNGSGQNVAQMEPAEDDIPCVYLYTGGVGMPFTKGEGERQIRMVYESRTQSDEYYLTAKVQGGSSAADPNYKKRNWTFKFYTDGTYEKKLKLSFKEWPAMNKFVLKAGWVIPGHLRNVGAAKVWGQIMKTRPDFDSLPEELRNSPNLGATDGFHVRVFVDGMYWGVYDWIVAKDQLFGQDKNNPAHSILNSERQNQESCAFATTTPTIGGNWSEELQDSMTADTKTSMENWIKFVAGATDEEFVANAESYFDVQSVIDAICFDRIIMPVDNMCRNQIVFKYDKKWYMGKWDLDAILGLPPVAGQAWFTYNTEYQEGYVAHKDFGVINMLYKRTEELFLERFKARYWELRNGPLSENNLNRVFGQLSDRLRSIEGLLAEENAATTGNGQFTAMPNVGKDTIYQIREFVVKRCSYMDGVITELGDDSSGDTTEKTLTGISATYSGGSVPVGTAVSALTGVVVTATYDDGTTATVTGYTLSGTIAEGANTITVTYDGKTTTFTVTGIAETADAGILEGVTWHSGYVGGGAGNLGVIGDSDIDVYTDAFDVSGVSHIYVVFGATNNQLYSARIVFWSDATASGKETCVGKIEGTNVNPLADGDIPAGAKYARISVNNSSKAFTGVTIRETADGEIIGELAYP